MPQVFSINSPRWNIEHIRRSQQYGERLMKLYERAIDEAAKIASQLTPDPSKPFLFDNFPGVKKRADAIVRTLARDIIGSTHEATAAEWEMANRKNDEMVRHILGNSKLKAEQLEKYMKHNSEALSVFQNRKVAGMNLSQRVWNYAGQFKQEIELGLDIGLGEGRSAAQLSRDLRANLKEPDKLFRRVRDKHGQLQLSKAAKAYNPGRGVYRSSYKNALRMTRTEVNMAYRTADCTRWKQLDFVVGFEVVLSNNHPVPDICDDLKGRYPKTFLFRGWHPQCRCHMNSILATEDELNDMERDMLRGEKPGGIHSQNTVDAPPEKFERWVNANREKIEAAKSPPYFVLDNKPLVKELTVTAFSLTKKAMDTIPDFTQRVYGFADKTGVTTSEVSIKSMESMERKANTDYQGDYSRITDAVRNTFIVPAKKQANFVEKLKKEFNLTRIKWQSDEMGYTGVLINAKADTGLMCEMQVNSKQMMYAKDEHYMDYLTKAEVKKIQRQTGLPPGMGHDYYDECRKLKGNNLTAAQIARKEELQKISTDYYTRIRAAKLK